MKNTLAENLLRFGVKNLSEADLIRLTEQATPPAGSVSSTEANPNKLPTAKVTAKSPTKRLEASFKTELGTTATWIAYIKMDPTTKKWNLVEFRFTPDGKGTASVLRIQDNRVQEDELLRKQLENGEIGYTGPGMSPLASLNNLLQQVAKQTGVQWGVSGDLQRMLTSMPNRYYNNKTDKLTIPTEALKPGVTYGVRTLLNPDTNQVVNRLFYIGDAAYGVYLEPNGTLSKNNISNLAKKLKTQPNYVRAGLDDYYAIDQLKSDISKISLQNVLN